MQSVIGGLPLETSLCSSFQLLKYFMLLILFDILSGALVSNCISGTKTFVLLRSGWKVWFRKVLLRALCAVGCAALLLLLPTWLMQPEPETLFAWLLFLLYAASCAAIQTLLIAYTQKESVGLATLLFFQLCSVFLSKQLPGNWKLLLFGNWGCWVRTTSAGEVQGVPLSACIVLNLATLLLIYVFGWRLVRRHHQKR